MQFYCLKMKGHRKWPNLRRIWTCSYFGPDNLSTWILATNTAAPIWPIGLQERFAISWSKSCENELVYRRYICSRCIGLVGAHQLLASTLSGVKYWSNKFAFHPEHVHLDCAVLTRCVMPCQLFNEPCQRQREGRWVIPLLNLCTY